jgi:hypothetical protein
VSAADAATVSPSGSPARSDVLASECRGTLAHSCSPAWESHTACLATLACSSSLPPRAAPRLNEQTFLVSRPLRFTPTPASRSFTATTSRPAGERRGGNQCLRFLPRHAPSRDLPGERERSRHLPRQPRPHHRRTQIASRDRGLRQGLLDQQDLRSQHARRPRRGDAAARPATPRARRRPAPLRPRRRAAMRKLRRTMRRHPLAGRV